MTLIAVSLFALAASAAEPAVPPAKPLYASKCASCHGKDAKGNAGLAKMFKVPAAALDLRGEEIGRKTDEELVKTVADGRGKMPAFKAKLKGAEIAGLVAYLRSLAAPAETGPKAEK